MGKTKDLFKKSTDTKGIFHAKMGSIKDRVSDGMDLTEAIKKFKHSCLQDKHSAQLQGLAEGLLQPPLLPPDRQSA